MFHAFFSASSPWFHGWLLGVTLLVGTVWVLLTWLCGVLLLEEGRVWLQARQRQQRVTDDALRYVEQKQRQLHMRTLVDEDRRRRQLAAAAHPERRS